MKNFLFIIALLLIFVWSFGFIGYGIGGAFHGVLVLALLVVVTKIILELKSRNKKVLEQNRMKFRLMKFKSMNIKLIN